MDSQSSKKLIATFMKERGFLGTASKNIFIKDCGFYLIVVESRPVWNGLGMNLDVGVTFMWSNYYGITYDYSNGDTRVNVPNHPLGAIIFEEPGAEQKLYSLLSDGMQRAAEYQNLMDFDTFRYKIETRRDFVCIANPGHEKKDLDLAIAKMFSGDALKSMEILQNASVNSEVARRLLDKSHDIEAFRAELMDIINNCRSMMSKKFKRKLAPINSIWV